MQVKDVMVPVVECLHPDTTLREASERINALLIDPMPVCDEGKIVGLLYTSDIQERASRDVLATGSVPVSDVMSRHAVCLQDDAEVDDALKKVGGASSSTRWPVTDPNGALVGIVSLHDLAAHALGDAAGVTAVEDVESVDQLVQFEDDKVDYMSDASFPASDPPAPPTESGQGPGG